MQPKQNLHSAPILRPSELGVARYSDKNFNPNAFIRKIPVTDDSTLTSVRIHMATGECRKWSYAADNFIYIYLNVRTYFMLIKHSTSPNF